MRRILVVDHQRDSAESLARVLQAMGHDTRFTTDALDAMSVAREFAPELALIDIGMPVLNGYELARLFRSASQNIRLAALTGFSSDDYRSRAGKAGFEGYVIKPADAATLEHLIQTLFPAKG